MQTSHASSCGHECCEQCSTFNTPALLLRLAAALVLVLHGYGKLFGGIPAFTGMLTGLGFPLPDLLAWVVAILEFFGGIALALGLFTRNIAWLLVVQFAIILLFVKKFAFPASDTDVLILATALALALAGPGMWSLDAKLFKRKDRAPSTITAPPASSGPAS